MDTSDFSENYPEILSQLKILYAKKILEIEDRYKFDEFHSARLRGADFEARPMIMLLGQYSVGKTSFIEYILKRPFPGERVGPEPTTDRFVAVMHGNEDQIIPGNALSVDAEKPFHGLNAYGTGLLSKFEGSLLNVPLLKKITLVDTPGILSGEKQRLGRSYDFVKVCQWFANRSDMILLLFDAHKLDISDEFKEAIECLKGCEDKVRVVLNKADQITTQQLMRVYGALMWSLGKVIKTPEVVRVFIGSFWNKPYENEEMAKLFEAEQRDLLDELLDIPRNSAIRKINELVKRARLVKTHAYIVCHLREKMPMFIGKESTQKELIRNLSLEFEEISRTKKIPIGDFPDVAAMQQSLSKQSFSEFPAFSERLMKQIDEVLQYDLPRLMSLVTPKKVQIHNPFSEELRWDIDQESLGIFGEIFENLDPVNGQLSGDIARDTLVNTGIDIDILRKIWDLCDFEKDGQLDKEEFSLALHLTELAKMKGEVPDVLPRSLIPPSKRKPINKKGKGKAKS